MRSAAHTPAPWFVKAGNCVSARIDGRLVHIVGCDNVQGQPGQGEANARLIAAAPAMLKALRAIATGTVPTRLHAALAQATADMAVRK